MDFLWESCQKNLQNDDLLSNFYLPDESLDPFLALIPDHTDFHPQLWDNMEQTGAERTPQINGIVEISEEDTNFSTSPQEQLSEIQCESGSNTSSVAEVVERKKKRKRKIKRNESEERLPKIAFRTKSKVDVLEDGYKWRKYGKKSVKHSPHLRSYYKCSESSCCVKKKVERDPVDEEIVITTYEGKHSHESRCPTEIYCVADPFGSYHMIVLTNQGLCSSILPSHRVLNQ